MRFRSAAAFAITGLVLGQSAYATQFELTDDTVALVGNVERLVARFEDSLPDLARSHSLGYEEIQRANPGVDV
ncbi:MAG: hypothetical protein KDI32_07950, partial [Pseudomonadales bacterium]|nr:hypothetical protein [Pseudomonadales bacterium]